MVSGRCALSCKLPTSHCHRTLMLDVFQLYFVLRDIKLIRETLRYLISSVNSWWSHYNIIERVSCPHGSFNLIYDIIHEIVPISININFIPVEGTTYNPYHLSSLWRAGWRLVLLINFQLSFLHWLSSLRTYVQAYGVLWWISFNRTC